MAGVKISALPSVGAPLLTDIMPEVQPALGGVTFKVSFTQLLALFQANIQIAESQVTNLVTDLAAKVNRAGDTMTGFLILNADPVLPLGAATKQYVDNIASGLIILLAVYAASTTNLTAIYNNGVAGVGATLTNSGGLSAFSIDGVSPPVSSRILVKDQTTTFQNGIYILTTVGTGAIAWVLTRATDYDTPAKIQPGDLASVNNGTVNASTAWIQTATVTTIGVDPILWSKFGGVVLPLAISQGGTGATTAAGARANLGAAASGANTDITSMAGITGAIRYGNAGNTHFFGLRANAGATGPDIDFILPQTDGTANQALVTNGAGTLSFASVGSAATPTIQRFTSGSGTYTTPLNVKYLRIRCWGSGGGGGGCTSAGATSSGGGGGGGGGYVDHIIGTPAGSYAYAVGTGGTAGVAGANAGGAGSNTTFSTLTAGGGLGGGGGTGVTGGVTAGGGAAASGSGGNMLNTTGHIGGVGFVLFSSVGLSGEGGTCALGGSGGRVAGTTGSGSPGNSPGGGGGGGVSQNGAGAQAGFAGANGEIIVEEYYN